MEQWGLYIHHEWMQRIDVFCTYLRHVMKMLANMTQKSFKACFEFFLKLYDDLKADNELTSGENEKTVPIL